MQNKAGTELNIQFKTEKEVIVIHRPKCTSNTSYTELLSAYMASNKAHYGNRVTQETSPLKLLPQHNRVQSSFGLRTLTDVKNKFSAF
jgi:hypothetical protein